jgi:hypothetical protein
MGNIFQQPISAAKRKTEFGYTMYYVEQLKLQAELLERREKINLLKTKIKRLLNK